MLLNGVSLQHFEKHFNLVKMFSRSTKLRQLSFKWSTDIFKFHSELVKVVDKHLLVWSKLLLDEVKIINNTTSLFEENSRFFIFLSTFSMGSCNMAVTEIDYMLKCLIKSQIKWKTHLNLVEIGLDHLFDYLPNPWVRRYKFVPVALSVFYIYPHPPNNIHI